MIAGQALDHIQPEFIRRTVTDVDGKLAASCFAKVMVDGDPQLQSEDYVTAIEVVSGDRYAAISTGDCAPNSATAACRCQREILGIARSLWKADTWSWLRHRLACRIESTAANPQRLPGCPTTNGCRRQADSRLPPVVRAQGQLPVHVSAFVLCALLHVVSPSCSLAAIAEHARHARPRARSS